jgi:hypothetical protein
MPAPVGEPTGRLDQQVNHVSMMVPDESRMTALQCTLHPTEATIDLQADIAWDRLHPDSVQSVPIEEFGLSQKLRVTVQLFGVMSASLVMPSGSVVSSGDADGAAGFPGSATSLVSLLGSGDVGESTPQANMAAAETEIQNTPIVRNIVGSFLLDNLRRSSERPHRMTERTAIVLSSSPNNLPRPSVALRPSCDSSVTRTVRIDGCLGKSCRAASRREVDSSSRPASIVGAGR